METPKKTIKSSSHCIYTCIITLSWASVMLKELGWCSQHGMNVRGGPRFICPLHCHLQDMFYFLFLFIPLSILHFLRNVGLSLWGRHSSRSVPWNNDSGDISQYSTWLWTRWPMGRSLSPGRGENVLSFMSSRLVQLVWGILSLGVKQPGREADHSSPTSAKVSMWIYTSIPHTPAWRST
jgi:hypothetical protein